MKLVTVSFVLVLSSVLGSALSSNINIDGSCPTDGYGCLQCLSRGSGDIERCQQLYFFVTNTNTNNQAEMERYCSGDCPIILATANYYCGSSEAAQRVLFDACPGYNVLPTGSFNVNANYSEQHCLGNFGSDRCAECIGERTPEAVRCLQTYLLAQYSNNTELYTPNYCNSNCPLTLNSFSWYCADGTIFRESYNICHRNGASYCTEVIQRSQSDFDTAVSNCRSSCTSQSCDEARATYGCCLRDGLQVGVCAEINECPIETVGTTQNINIDGSCPFDRHGCEQCLSRNSDELERCEQLYIYLTETTNNDAEKESYCAGECPILLITANFYCTSGITSIAYREQLNMCPGYNVMPSGSVDINGNFSSQHCLDLRSEQAKRCSECINSRSSEPTQCLQLYLLSQNANVSQPYAQAFCTGSCPLTLTTSLWYCSVTSPATIFNSCRRMDTVSYCDPLIRDNQDEYSRVGSICNSNCTSSECNSGINMFGCCLRNSLGSGVCPNIPDCDVETAGTLTLLATPLIVAILNVMAYYMMN